MTVVIFERDLGTAIVALQRWIEQCDPDDRGYLERTRDRLIEARGSR